MVVGDDCPVDCTVVGTCHYVVCEEFGYHHTVVYEVGEHEVVYNDLYLDKSGDFADYCYAYNGCLHDTMSDGNCYLVDMMVANRFEDGTYCCGVHNVGCID